MTAPKEVLDLVERFDRGRAAYRSPAYNETQLRREFLDPFFVALGWDVENRAGWAEPYKEVIHEDAIKIGGFTKAPDYCFRVGGTRKFFVEAKKPAVDIRTDASPAFQLRRYAWSAKLPLSILTDFEEFAVYDCRIKPTQADKASLGRVRYLAYTDYPEKWEEVASVFSKDAVLKGSFDKYAEKSRTKKGTAEVDAAFLQEIESWRDLLARNLALRNPRLTQRELNFAVQRTIDRIIFLRICEDRGIEPEGRLLGLTNAPGIYARLLELYRRADERYNSGLFHFRQEKWRAEDFDRLTPGLAVEDKVLKDILKNLYYPDSPYEFSVLPADILGQVYEQFLGKVIRLTAGHQAKVEDKPEVKKAGGVFYTPTYIVEYIVRNTVGRLLEGKTPKEAAKITILDPACGSGSFLLGAYQLLLDWHREWYVDNGKEKWATGKKPVLYQGMGAEWRLTTAERKRILTNNVFGVDIDPQAVETTKLSLLLKVLEGESEQTLSSQFKLFQERALPDLGSNIKCGNSLIGSDFYQGASGVLPLFGEEERLRINVFDWEKEFPRIFGGANHGFDAVIGNPPYVLLQDEFRDDRQLEYFRRKFGSASYKVDTYHLFIEKSIGITSARGLCSLITPANFMTNNKLSGLRRLMVDSGIEKIVVIDGKVFSKASVDNAILVLSPSVRNKGTFRVITAAHANCTLEVVSEIKVNNRAVKEDQYSLFTGSNESALNNLWTKVCAVSNPLGDMAYVNFGKQLRDRKKYPTDVIRIPDGSGIPSKYRVCLTGKDITRYRLAWGKLACLNDRSAQCGGCWDNDRQDAKGKLITRQIGRYPEFAMDTVGYQCLNTVFMVNAMEDVGVNPSYLLAILNSKLLRLLWTDRYYDKRNTFPKIKGTFLKQLPIRRIEFSVNADRGCHDRMVALVESMLSLHKQLASANTGHEKTALQRQIDATDRQIDQLVYELYGLTDEEIRIVEGGIPKD